MSRSVKSSPADIIDAAEMAEVRRVALDKAKQGDMVAAGIVERAWRRRDRPIVLDLPAITGAASLADGQARIIAAATAGQLTPRQARDLATLLEWRRRALETVDLEKELQEIEEENARREERENATRAKTVPR